MSFQLKQMEVQLEEEYEDKQKALREKRELESKLATLSDQVHWDVCCWASWCRSWGQKAGSWQGWEVLCSTCCHRMGPPLYTDTSLLAVVILACSVSFII